MAHAELDRTVDRCYRPEPSGSDRECVEHIFRLYEQLITPLLPGTPAAQGRQRPPSRFPPAVVAPHVCLDEIEVL